MLKGGKGFLEIYGLLFERVRPKLEEQLQVKQTELDKMLDQYASLPERLKQRAVARMAPLQEELDEIRGELTDWRKPYLNLREELTARREALERAKRTIARDVAGRQKADALRGVVDRIVCRFKHKKKPGAKNNGKSILNRVDIYAVSGEVLTGRFKKGVFSFSAGGTPGRDSIWNTLFYREFSPDEVAEIRRAKPIRV